MAGYMTKDDLNSMNTTVDMFSSGVDMFIAQPTRLILHVNNGGGTGTTPLTIDYEAGTQFEIIGRDANNTNEYLIKFNDQSYAFITIPIDKKNVPGSADAQLLSHFNNAIIFEYHTDGTSDAQLFDKEVEKADQAKQNRLDAMRNADANATSDSTTLAMQDVAALYVKNSNTEHLVPPLRIDADDYTKSRLFAVTRSYGVPPQWTKYVDPRVYSFSPINNTPDNKSNDIAIGLGRRYSSVIVSNPTIIEIAPGTMKYSNWLLNASDVVNDMDNIIGGADNGTIEQIAKSLDNNHGSFYKITPNFNNGNNVVFAGVVRHGYITYVDLLMKYAAIFLSRVDSKKGDTGEGEFYPYYSYGNATDTEPIPMPLAKRKPLFVDGTSTEEYAKISWYAYNKPLGWVTVGGFLSGAKVSLNGPGTGDSSDKFDYIKFYLSGSTSANDNFETNVEDSLLSNLANTINSGLKEAAYFTDAVGSFADDLNKGFTDIFNSTKLNGENPLAGLTGLTTLLGGAKITFPKIITESSYGKSINCECTFVSVYGETESIYLNSIRPYLHLLAFVLPHQVRSNLEMYTFPFIVKAYCRGLFNVEMGVISSFSVTRGGNDNALWSFEGAAELITVNFEVTPLLTNLVMSSINDGPGWVLRNKGLAEYMSAITAYDARNDKYELSLEIAENMGDALTIKSKISAFFNTFTDSKIFGDVATIRSILREHNPIEDANAIIQSNLDMFFNQNSF